MGFLLLIMSCIIMSACGDKAENAGITETKAVVAKGTEENAPDEVYEYLSEQADPVVHESDMGYSMTYDPSVITLDDTGEADIFS